MNEIIKDYTHQNSYKIVVNKLQKVLTYVICRQMDEMSRWNVCGNLTWKLAVCELHHI